MSITRTINTFAIMPNSSTQQAKRAYPQADTSKLEEEIDQLVAPRQLYGLTEDNVKIVEEKDK